MALSDKNIVITPNVGQSTDPKIVFSAANANVVAQNITITAYPTDNGTLSFEGSAGQLFSITNILTGTIFSVNDTSGIPSIEVLDTGLVKLAQYSGNVLIGTGTDATAKLQVTGNISAGNIIAGGVRQTVSTSAPTGAMTGDQWYDTATDTLFQYIYDGTNYIWIDISGQPLNVNIGAVQGTSLSITGAGSLTGALTLNSTNSATAIINGGTTGGGNIGSSGQAFNTVFAKASSAQYADLAEKYTSDVNYAPGTVLIFGGAKEVTISTVSHDTRVAGVVTTNPGFIMNETLTNSVTVALTGRVPCQVLGPINKGDRLVASQHPGVAQRLMTTLYEPGCIIGKSLEILDTNEIKLIEIAIGRF